MRTTSRRTAVGIAAAGLVAWTSAARAEAPEAGKPPAPAAQATAGDRQFLIRALGVNELELRLGRLASERARSPEVKAMGRQMTEKHGALGRQLGDLARAAGAPVEAELSAEQKATYARLSALPPDAFDAAFRETVDAGHVQELALYRDEAGHAASPELRTLVEQRVGVLEKSVSKAEAAKARSGPAATGTAGPGKY